MGKVGVITDTNSGITPELAKERGLHIMPMPFYVDGELKYEGVDFSQKDFYAALERDSDVSTSMPIMGNVMDTWDGLLKEYDEIVYIPMSSGLSSSCETARLLAEDEYEGRVQVVDNHRIASTMLLSAVEAKAMADEGKSALEIKEYLERTAAESTIYIMVDTLKYLKKGGRLTPAVAAIGTLLKIKPVLQIQGGKLDTYAKARTLKQAKNIMKEAIANDFRDRFGDPEANNIVLGVHHTENVQEAEIFRQELCEIYPGKNIFTGPLALSIACHIGPGALAVVASKSFIKEI